MSVKPRTIDNLGMDTSVRYAKDKESLDLRLLDESKWLPPRLEVSVTKPYVPSDFDTLFSLSRTVQWASFAPPPDYEMQTRALFSYQLIPSIGTYEKQEADTEKLNYMENVFSKKKEDGKRGKREKRARSEEEREEEQEEAERQTLLALFKCIEKFDRTLSHINSRRNQYQRG